MKKSMSSLAVMLALAVVMVPNASAATMDKDQGATIERSAETTVQTPATIGIPSDGIVASRINQSQAAPSTHLSFPPRRHSRRSGRRPPHMDTRLHRPRAGSQLGYTPVIRRDPPRPHCRRPHDPGRHLLSGNGDQRRPAPTCDNRQRHRPGPLRTFACGDG